MDPPICERFEIVFGVNMWWEHEEEDDGECGIGMLQLMVSSPVEDAAMGLCRFEWDECGEEPELCG